MSDNNLDVQSQRQILSTLQTTTHEQIRCFPALAIIALSVATTTLFSGAVLAAGTLNAEIADSIQLPTNTTRQNQLTSLDLGLSNHWIGDQPPAGDLGLTDNPTLRDYTDDFDLVFTEVWEEGRPVSVDIGKVAKPYVVNPIPKRVKEPAPKTPARLHPLVARWLAERNPEEIVEVVISRPETIDIPRFPEPDTEEPLLKWTEEKSR